MGEPRLKEQNLQDWHPYDVRAALAKRGYTLADISRLLGLADRTANEVQRKPYPRVEQAIAGILGMKPYEIWPSRYDDKDRPLTGLHAVKTNNR